MGHNLAPYAGAILSLTRPSLPSFVSTFLAVLSSRQAPITYANILIEYTHLLGSSLAVWALAAQEFSDSSSHPGLLTASSDG